MPKFNPDAQLNIHELAIEEPEKQAEVFFDPERDITPEDWEKIGQYKKEQMSYNWQSVAEICAEEKILGKDPNLSDSDWENLQKYRRSHLYDAVMGWRDFVEKAKNEAIAGNVPELTDDDWQSIQKHMKAQRTKQPQEHMHCFFANYILAKAVLGRPVKLSEDDWKYLEEFREKNKKSIGPLIEILETETILGRRPKLTSSDWEFLKQERERYRHDRVFQMDSNWHSSVSIATTMAILSADEVRIPEGGGLELISHKKTDLQAEIPQMPEQKQF
ncbi:MAG: hypothetical protein A2360_04930 [Candidatus Staskawiczbacteria bacterium RIFOXYB1_FULL_32_11]|uniref:Uncharacterized protein n=1 Tax=Candidatus Staskawiczbacteria bacterium RIFOXYD1_FULL_32_13 TaxID=1802234 RepID=A0A1G2JPF5_9BACT|nr:MAG: hypothetical protein UR22_C0001G0007 [Parcubacteria group bacterium GW2011_GWC2_32_10]OGZ77720.1 MAG: hypothetical protein A2256_01495 [Candidatus Staskawiczbacteria bacterium RIFOXYA2_FULL_32_7]OGZ79760.1 MAG: hypothetical protein A2360_04930 [Candidatus Staskawiczbacteria bacterium RIFOXYB1_FULL_32_11]OGZ88138.1 MAG: hypothetical protein A2561_05525 [Candidatus Staskawiczbacteria bacterium RIFOXYD1_FULL_32_13]